MLICHKRSLCLKRQNVLKVLFLSLILSSCGLIEKFKTPEQPTDSKTETAAADKPSDANVDDLFSKTMNETKDETALNAEHKDAPSNVTNNETADNKNELKSLEDEFSGSGPKESVVKETPSKAASSELKDVKVEDALPEIKAEAPMASDNTNENADAGKVMTYKVQKGETLMQIAFKIYGDVGKWKELKQMNGSKISKNSALRSKMELKYKAPEKNFVWNPEGTPYMIKNGETLGTISNSVYQTPKKWKKLWENNKPLIKNPNVIYAGFTLYYKGSGMANYVQPKALQKSIAAKKVEAAAPTTEAKIAEEVKVEQAMSSMDEAATEAGVIDLTKNVQSAINREPADEIKADEVKANAEIDEALINTPAN